MTYSAQRFLETLLSLEGPFDNLGVLLVNRQESLNISRGILSTQNPTPTLSSKLFARANKGELTTASGLPPASPLAEVAAAATPCTAANPDFLTCSSKVSRSGFNPSGIRARRDQVRARSTKTRPSRVSKANEEREGNRGQITLVSVRIQHLLEFFLDERHVINDQGLVALGHQLSGEKMLINKRHREHAIRS